MSKNFELLHYISNEKELFQTLDGWEDAGEIPCNADPEAEFEGRTNARTRRHGPLPDVFQAVDHALGPFDLVSPDLGCATEIAQKPTTRRPIEQPSEKRAEAEAPSATHEDRFPVNPLTPLSAVLDIPQAWVKPEILPGPNDGVELELEPETPQSVAVPDGPKTAEKVVGCGDAQVQGRSPAMKGKTRNEAPHTPPFGTVEMNAGKSNSQSRARKNRTRNPYRDPRREAIAREEELKLVQRIFLAEEHSPRMVMFSGFEGDTGCASICIRAGEILASQGEGSVCLVDMGFRVPSLHEYCGVPNERGLAEALADSNPIQEFAKQLSPNLWVLPGGHDATHLNFAKVADRLRIRMEELRGAFRYVVIHSGSLWLDADAMLISKWTDGVVLILEAHSTRRDTARRIKESLAVANARMLGVVLNNRTYPIPETLYSRL